jgi:signal transduction histidine kinase
MVEDGVKIVISDNGKGMPEEATKKVTEAFYRVDKARSRAQGGAGLGLSLVKKIIELHNGSLDISSELGKGTSVTVILRGGTIIEKAED